MKKYNPKNTDKKDERFKVPKNATNFFDGRKKIIVTFEEGIFLMSEKVLNKNQIEKQAEKQVKKKKRKERPI